MDRLKLLKLNVSNQKTVSFGKIGKLTNPIRIHHIRGDGNCFFRSLCYFLTGSEEEHQVLRDRVVRHMQTINKILKGYLNQNVKPICRILEWNIAVYGQQMR